MNTVTIKRSDKEQAADEQAAEEAKLSVHAWRRVILNTANGLSRLPSQLQALTRERIKGHRND